MNYETNTLLIKHPGLKEVLNMMMLQANTSKSYIKLRNWENLTISQIWDLGKRNLIYKNDKNGVEQLQSVGTLFENNIHNIPGAGDCDCFVIFTLALILCSNKIDNSKTFIYLQGNTRAEPSHVLVKCENTFIDFTQPQINSIRKYNFFDEIAIK
jgi:hypothetical protein